MSRLEERKLIEIRSMMRFKLNVYSTLLISGVKMRKLIELSESDDIRT